MPPEHTVQLETPRCHSVVPFAQAHQPAQPPDARTFVVRALAGQFPDTYPAYKHSTKMLVPYVF